MAISNDSIMNNDLATVMDGLRYLQALDDRRRVVIDLLENKPWIIVEDPTGIRYAGQVGGMACAHPEVEGFLLPADDIGLDWSPLLGVTCGVGPIGEETADKIEVIWPKSKFWTPYSIIFDRTRLAKSTEAWFPVRFELNPQHMGEINGHQFTDVPGPLARFLDGKQGWLLMPDNVGPTAI